MKIKSILKTSWKYITTNEDGSPMLGSAPLAVMLLIGAVLWAIYTAFFG